MKTIIKYMLLACILGSCGTLKKNMNKSTSEEKTAAEVSTVTSRTVTESVDTIVNMPGSAVNASEALTEFTTKGVLSAENNQLQVEVKYDQNTQKVTVTGNMKPVQIPVSVNRKIVEQINQNSKIEADTKTAAVLKQKERIPAVTWEFWVFILLIITGLCWYVKKHWPF